MRKLTYPDWVHWQTAVEAGLSLAVKESRITSYRINGAATGPHIPVKKPDEQLGNMPFVQTAMTGVQEGWDDEFSAIPDYEGHTHTNLGGTKSVKQTNFYRERLSWTIEVFSQKYTEALEIAQSIRRYFGPLNQFTINWQDETQSVFCKLSDYNIVVAEATKEGHTEFFLASWTLTLSVKSDLADADELVKNIVDVAAETVSSDGTNDSEELTKNL